MNVNALFKRPFWAALLLSMLMGMQALAQEVNVTGVLKEANGEPLIGATISVPGKPGVGAVTDYNGNFAIKVQMTDSLHFTYVGFEPYTIAVKDAKIPLVVVLQENKELLSEVVVIGYGSVQKKDLTGAVTTITDKNFKKGLITTPDQLISGKVAGVQITQGGGAPGSGSRIRIRGGASLNASNDPLIVIDGVPIENSVAAGAPSILSSINPADIESMNVLKDASATAIYGSRASNGVIIITTKSGKLGQKLSVQFNTQFSASTPSKYIDVMDGDQFRALIKEQGDQDFINLLGNANTDWQKEIYRTAYGTDNNLSVSGSTAWLPYRVSLGYFKQNGILRTDHMDRGTVGISLTPRFLNGDLAVDLNIKGTQTKNRYGNRDAIGAAIRFDPTKPVMSDDPLHQKYGGYYSWLSGDVPNARATYNPVALLETKEDQAKVNRSIGNLKIDYRLPFLKDLRLNLNLGYDYTSSSGTIYIPTWAPQTYFNGEPGKGGVDNEYKQEKINKLLDFYANYRKELPSIKSNIDLMAGYSYQDWKTNIYNFPDKTAGGIINSTPLFENDYPQNTLVSFYGRLNYSLMDRYLFTATIRTDGSSRFSKENRWGVFPSMAFAWRLKEEAFLKDVSNLSDLKLRLGYGVTGQQDGIANYSYLSFYNLSGNTSMYQLGDKFYNMYRPAAYDAEIKWEQTVTSNIGLDFGFLNQRISGSVDYYFKKTKDLLNSIPVPAGANFSNVLLTNVGNIENSGLEMALNLIPVDNEEWYWSVNLNATYNDTKITKLNQTEDPSYLGVLTGGIQGGTGNTIQIHTVGYAPNTFFVYKQAYDNNGQPIEGVFADLNGDGKINENDRYHYKNPEPDWFLGFSTSLTYKNLTVSTALRGSFGNYVYDNVASELAAYRAVLNPLTFLQNTLANVKDYDFYTNRYLSDMFVKPASFVKMDNLNVTYDFGRLWNEKVGLRVGATVQNVFTISEYKGIDPEIPGGIDANFYPVPRIFSVNLGLTF